MKKKEGHQNFTIGRMEDGTYYNGGWKLRDLTQPCRVGAHTIRDLSNF